MSNIALITFFLTFFLWWSLILLFERYMGMQPLIAKNDAFNELDDKNNTELIYRKSSKSLDKNGEFRIILKPSLYFAKAIAFFMLFMIGLYPFIDGNPSEYVRLFFKFDESVIKLPFVQIASATILSWYLFEIIALMQYYKIQWSTVIHHWLTAFAAIIVLLGVFTPAAILYGIIMVALSFPLPLLQASRLFIGFKHPVFIKKAHIVLSNYYKILLIICIGLQLLMLIHGITTGAYSNLYIATIIFCICGWCYDDLQVVKSLKHGAKRKYAQLDLQKLK
ncbi:hypothetical protein FRY74_05920 [Vicingus serpentipes]|uniref:Uncharacterized protein n=1 Tax=Vicingus serpentipes TaxID=1926625 RepID=A0A5C6RUD9_9FLAO|nr:hypothetical protein [Vicingus serpentipes]TXB66106.1 hypothetical protein FRY74_05920 [Vicingus serpentipes]